MAIKVMGARSGEGPTEVAFSPRQVVPNPTEALRVPKVLAIVASTDLAAGLAGDPVTCPDGFVVEGPLAGGHNAPPRGPRQLDELNQPVYGERDVVDISSIVALGLPVWLAGAYGTPQGLRRAQALGAAGIQAGTVFAYSDESGFDPILKDQVRAAALAGDLSVRADWRVSPTGFPFRVAEIPGTLTDHDIAAARTPVCDLGCCAPPTSRPTAMSTTAARPSRRRCTSARAAGKPTVRGGCVCATRCWPAAATRSAAPMDRSNRRWSPPAAMSVRWRRCWPNVGVTTRVTPLVRSWITCSAEWARTVKLMNWSTCERFSPARRPNWSAF